MDSSAEAEDLGVEELTSELTSVPIIRGGDVSGYVIMQFSFAADRALLGDSKLDPMPYIRDAVFRVAFTNSEIDFRHLKSGDLDRLTDSIATEANRRLGAKIQLAVATTHKGDQLSVDDLYQRLSRGETAQHFFAYGLFPNLLYKVFNHRQGNVSLQHRHPHLAQGILDIVLGNSALAAQGADCGGKSFC